MNEYRWKGDKHMATEEKFDDTRSGVPEEAVGTQGDAQASVSVPNKPWYTYLSEDWLATIFGLLLVLLLVVGWLHSIP
jgi:hypothetical protein